MHSTPLTPRELAHELAGLFVAMALAAVAIVACGSPPPPNVELRAVQVDCLISRATAQLACVDANVTRPAIDACRDRVRALDCAALQLAAGDAGPDGAP